MKWATLKSLANGFVHRKDLPWDALQALAAADIGRDLDVIENETISDELIPEPTVKIAGAFKVALPADFGRLKAFKQGGKDKRPQDLQRFLAADYGGFYCVTGETILTRSIEPALLAYGANPEPFADDNAEGVIARKYPHVWLFALLKHGAAFGQDLEAETLYQNNYQRAIMSANEGKAWQNATPGNRPVIQGGM